MVQGDLEVLDFLGGPGFPGGQVVLLLVVQGVFLLVVLILKDIFHHLAIHHLQDLHQVIHQSSSFLKLQVFGSQMVVIHQESSWRAPIISSRSVSWSDVGSIWCGMFCGPGRLSYINIPMIMMITCHS